MRIHAAAQRIRHQLLRHRPDEHIGAGEDGFAQRDDAIDGFAVGQLTGGIDAAACVVRAPRAYGVEILERETDWVHHLMTGRARRAGAMLGHLLA